VTWKKACKCLDHRILLSILEFYGIKGEAKLWFESCFNNSIKGFQSQTMSSIKITFLHGKK